MSTLAADYQQLRYHYHMMRAELAELAVWVDAALATEGTDRQVIAEYAGRVAAAVAAGVPVPAAPYEIDTCEEWA